MKRNRIIPLLILMIAAFLVILSGCSRDTGDGEDSAGNGTEAENGENGNGEILQMSREVINFNTGWLYSPSDYKNAEVTDLDDSGFESVSIPHANTLLTDHKGPDFAAQIESYRFVSWYRRHFTLGEEYAGRRVTVEFEGVATVADVYVNGTLVGTHKGAYTGFSFDITDYITSGDNVIAVRVDSERQPDIPPEGGSVDYCLFGGIVRDVNMIVTSPAYITDTFITTPDVSAESGKIHAATSVINHYGEPKELTVTSALIDADGVTVTTTSGTSTVAAGGEHTFEYESETIASPHLWSTDDPYLYTVVTTVSDGDTVIDNYETKLGFRWFSFEDDGFYLNGVKTELIGVNRHEQWPWIGRAVNDKLQRADADLIKETGFNAVRCSHYPQDPSFLERCDEIGLIVFEEAPGWQYIGGEEWQAVYRENIREMILRDRNHASIVSWGTRVNESFDNDELYRDTNRIAKELDPTRPTHGVRRMESYGDSHFLDGEDIFAVNYQYPDKPRYTPFIITEHSMDWYNGHGFSWASDADALTFTKSFAEVVDYYYGNELCLGGFAWSMFDYDNEVNYTNTDNVFYSGLYDIFRIEKMPSYFYKSQRDPATDPMVYIANYWTENSPRTVTVFSNCDEIELFVNGVSVGKQTPSLYMNLPHPMYEFKNVTFEPGELRAVGYINGAEVASYTVTTPGAPVKLILKPQYDTITADGSDFTSVAIYAVDENGQVVPYANNKVTIALAGDGKFIGEETIALENGHAAFFVQSIFGKTGHAVATVSADGMGSASCEIEITEFTEKTVPVSEGAGTEEPIKVADSIDINDSQSGVLRNHFNYIGSGWASGPQSGCYFADNHYSRTAGDSVTFEFAGTNIKWYGTVAPNHGIMNISIDGGDETTIDCYSSERTDSILLFDSGELADGTHTLTVTVTGNKNSASGDCYINVDRVSIVGGDVSEQRKYSFPNDTVKFGGYANQGSTYEWWVPTTPHYFYVDTVDFDAINSFLIRYGHELGDAQLAIYAFDNGGKPVTEEQLREFASDPSVLGDAVATADIHKLAQWGYCSLVIDGDGLNIIEDADYFEVMDSSSPLNIPDGTGERALIVAITGNIASGAYFDYIVIE